MCFIKKIQEDFFVINLIGNIVIAKYKYLHQAVMHINSLKKYTYNNKSNFLNTNFKKEQKNDFSLEDECSNNLENSLNDISFNLENQLTIIDKKVENEFENKKIKILVQNKINQLNQKVDLMNKSDSEKLDVYNDLENLILEIKSYMLLLNSKEVENQKDSYSSEIDLTAFDLNSDFLTKSDELLA
ncbi:hypothetical protein [Spiroplasma endosymbiont of Atherix ibis]|uniref:hypothetical protein n=1 Tax=Spiroplasma endosymbiont of Atherix ibis TaxID=3066291 RepID=UPI0030D21AFE